MTMIAVLRTLLISSSLRPVFLVTLLKLYLVTTFISAVFISRND